MLSPSVPFFKQELLIKQTQSVVEKDEDTISKDQVDIPLVDIKVKPVESKLEIVDSTKLMEMRAQMSSDEFNTFLTNSVNKMLKRNEREGEQVINCEGFCYITFT